MCNRSMHSFIVCKVLHVLAALLHCERLCMCRSLRDMMHALDLDGHAVHKPQLSTVAESASQVVSDHTSSGSDSASVSQSLKVGPRVNSLKRSPLGRSVVTALEAELDQVHTAPEPRTCKP